MANAGMGFDAGIHHRLRVAWLVAFVVAEPPETDQIDHHVFAETLAIPERDLDHAKCGLWVVGVNVKDRRLGYLGGVRRIDRASSELGRGRKSYLIIDHDVN